MTRFDWYQATVMDSPSNGVRQISKLGHSLVPCDSLAKAYRYKQGWHVKHNDLGNVATILCGGNGADDTFHAWASSDNTDNFVSLVRDTWGGCHRVTRADPAQDFIEAGADKRILRVMLQIGKRHKLKCARTSDPLDKEAGITQYLGAPGSDYRVRGYQKGYEVAGKIDSSLGARIARADMLITNVHTGELVKPSDWFRVEGQIRPRTDEGKFLLSRLTPEESFGCTPWMRELAKEVLSLDLEEQLMRTRKNTTLEESVFWLTRQYGCVLEQIVHDMGEAKAMAYLMEVRRQQKENSQAQAALRPAAVTRSLVKAGQ